MNTLTRANNDDWYNALIEECKAIITETEFTARWALVEGYHHLGKRILEDNDNFERQKIYGQEIVSRVTESLEVSSRTIWRAIQFAKKYPELDQVPGGKAVSWRRVCNELLPSNKSKEIDTERLLEDGTVTCPRCQFEFKV